MADENSAAQPGPEAQAQTSGEDKTKRAGNLSGAEAAAMFLKKDLAAQQKPPAEQEAPAQAEGTTPANEEPQGTSAEAQPEDNADETAQAESEDKPEGEADDDLSKSTTLDPKVQERINRRIGKEVAKRKALEAQLNEVRAQLAEMPAANAQAQQQPPAAIPTAAPLAHIEDVAGLQKLQQDAKQAIRFADSMLERARDGEALPEGYTKEMLRDVKQNAQDALDDQIPARFQFLQARHNADQTAFTKFPFLKDRTTNEYLTAQYLLRQHPELAHSPFKNTALGVMVLGLQAMQQRDEAAKKAEAKPKAPPAKPAGDQTAVSAGAASTRAPATAAKQQLAKAASELKQKGNVSGSDAAKFLMQRELARTSR